MKKIFIFFAPGLEEIEGLTPMDLLRRSGADISVISITDERTITGSHGITIVCDDILANCSFDDCSIIVLPGGMPGTANLEACEPLMARLDEFYSDIEKGAEKYIAAICAAPSILAHRGILKGKKATIYPGMEDHLTASGAAPSADRVVRDGHIITACGIGAAGEFGLELVKLVHGEEKAAQLKKGTLYK